ncbi:MAG: hypothetical protein EAZ78_11965 [Oscillatoriales cyanobacterium]|uniref:Type I restriction modification DNA specificity domain-containing protein n=1 Tax=Microcoleus anatoxicus PTRS2 TaxID=2705321 RepID=A0ABU8YNL5_9CYAN|nr:MAG: hypothetical protein EA000_08580 [Oscillatoriales cyanobacterium]TAD96074.1 MAG: hypothetical protein EAZ98_13575 [Oscillatoriales cyanobacterium]TAE03756.1 MAG: hypothetical protein EAZ96_11850 [Oscillatoriales cyanobacterium]TAF03558.1 MAG: hypothetical protein EAZ78_11965 [Oscillatoriales cyanobacterium]TAF39402.1 MAG: hypothetical protein EAZ68_12235 [Oscillatoriales cyanobacterium]
MRKLSQKPGFLDGWAIAINNVNECININLGTFANQRFPCPDVKTQKIITCQLEELSFETQRLETIYHQKLAVLKKLKQSILQKAFTGELTADTANEKTKVAKERIAT